MMKILFMMLFFFIIMFSLNTHYLSFLISIEFLVIMIMFTIMNYKINIWFYLIYLIYSVCEAVLGLSLLISMNFEYGHQKLIMLNLC
uniref:NADH dehydrogenase subunit 4L n=1 Tax=Ceratina smaragdula TaxID=710033 RepID=UPI002079616E|nr:NADH dehydrogenase subunit 4L [Ceratina smaragdula]URX52625.1 NADH dehydrogenase subunit 4L [Ceratina smaragdula]